MARFSAGSAFKLSAAVWLLAVAMAALSCEADLESRCVGGNGVCEEQDYGATTGGGGAPPGCLEACDPMVGLGMSGELPCEIDTIMDNCRRCHTSPVVGGAPFPLDTYAETQELYFDSPIWFRMRNVVETDFMPLSDPKLTSSEKAKLFAWICACSPPREDGVTCN